MLEKSKFGNVSQDNWLGFFKSVSAIKVRKKKRWEKCYISYTDKCKCKVLEWTLKNKKPQGLFLGQMGNINMGYILQNITIFSVLGLIMVLWVCVAYMG